MTTEAARAVVEERAALVAKLRQLEHIIGAWDATISQSRAHIQTCLANRDRAQADLAGVRRDLARLDGLGEGG